MIYYFLAELVQVFHFCFRSIWMVGESPNIPKMTNRILSAVLAPLGAANYSILTRGETAERVLFVSLLKEKAYEHDEAASDIFRSTVPCRRP